MILSVLASIWRCKHAFSAPCNSPNIVFKSTCILTWMRIKNLAIFHTISLRYCFLDRFLAKPVPLLTIVAQPSSQIGPCRPKHLSARIIPYLLPRPTLHSASMDAEDAWKPSVLLLGSHQLCSRLQNPMDHRLPLEPSRVAWRR